MAERHRLFARLGAVLARLHNIPYADTGPINIRDVTQEKLDRYTARVAAWDLIPPAELERPRARLAELITEILPPDYPSLVHHDLLRGR